VLLAVAAALLVGCDEGGIAGRVPEKIFGGRGIEPGKFVYPRAIAVGPEGCVFIVDKTARIQRFSPDGEFEVLWRMPRWEAGKPTGLTVDAQGRVYAADTHYHQVMIFDRDGKEVNRFGSQGEGHGQFIYPTRVAIDAKGNLYVSEYGGNDRISRFTPDYEYIASFGGPVDGEMVLSRPQAMAFDDEGMLWVADACHHRICRFTPEGEMTFSFGAPGREPGQLQYPYDVEFCPDGTLLVCEFGNNRIQRFDRQGKSLEIWGRTGYGPGELASPWGVAVGRNGRVYVLDSRNHRVQMFEM
jgi:DNA-binding beta-propeller fold protein YncE